MSDSISSKVLALDPATHCGWAFSVGTSGTWDFSIKRDESAGMRLLRFRSKLTEIYDLFGIDLVVFEAARHAAPGMAGALVVQSELQSVIKVFCEERKIPYRGYSPTEIKKHATGKGTASKEAMIDAAEKRWKKILNANDNEADALCLLSLALFDLGM